MVLVVDVGNTDTKFGVFEGENPGARWAVHSDLNRSAAEHEAMLRAMLAQLGVTGIRAAVIGSVVPGLTERMAAAVRAATGCEPLIARSQDVRVIDLAVDRPAQVGVDRVANALAAREFYQAPAIVVDLGSVTTFDIVNGAGSLAGVIITLGMQNTARALTAAGAQLPSIELARPARLVGTETTGSMQSGVYWGYVRMVRGLLEQLQSELGTDYRAIATGGQAPVVVEDVGLFEVVDLDLTLRGLWLIQQAAA
jgi:type III pantothenate kinase